MPPTDTPAPGAARVPVLDAATLAAALARVDAMREQADLLLRGELRDGALLIANVAAAAVGLAGYDEDADPPCPWWCHFGDEGAACCVCGGDTFTGARGYSEGHNASAVAHRSDCPALRLDAAIAALAGTGAA